MNPEGRRVLLVLNPSQVNTWSRSNKNQSCRPEVDQDLCDLALPPFSSGSKDDRLEMKLMSPLRSGLQRGGAGGRALAVGLW